MTATAVLASGGLDSAALLADLATRGAVHPIYVRAGLPWEHEEIGALRSFTDALVADGEPIEPVVELSVAGAALYGDHWSLTGQVPAYDEPDETVYLPGRNVILLGLAGVWCATHGVNTIALGTLGGNPFADATPEFFDSYARLLSEALGHELHVEAPFRGLGKEELVRRFSHLPLGLTLTCMAPVNGVHCNACNKCRERREAFEAAGVADPVLYAPDPGQPDLGQPDLGQEVA